MCGMLLFRSFWSFWSFWSQMCTTSFCHRVYHNKRKLILKKSGSQRHHTTPEHTNILHGIHMSTRNQTQEKKRIDVAVSHCCRRRQRRHCSPKSDHERKRKHRTLCHDLCLRLLRLPQANNSSVLTPVTIDDQTRKRPKWIGNAQWRFILLLLIIKRKNTKKMSEREAYVRVSHRN